MGNTEFDHIDRLYHYTTVESLALILKNRTLRLNPLDKMDDLQEAQSQSRQNYGQFIYVSSWTDMKEESIPMWKMYSSMTSGGANFSSTMPFSNFRFSAKGFSRPYIGRTRRYVSDTSVISSCQCSKRICRRESFVVC